MCLIKLQSFLYQLRNDTQHLFQPPSTVLWKMCGYFLGKDSLQSRYFKKIVPLLECKQSNLISWSWYYPSLLETCRATVQVFTPPLEESHKVPVMILTFFQSQYNIKHAHKQIIKRRHRIFTVVHLSNNRIDYIHVEL